MTTIPDFTVCAMTLIASKTTGSEKTYKKTEKLQEFSLYYKNPLAVHFVPLSQT